MKIMERLLMFLGLLLLAAITLWLNQDTPELDETSVEPTSSNSDPDYYIENFVATGVDKQGRQYIMDALRLAHFPQDGTSLIDQPHIIQYTDDAGPRHIYAESGLISSDGTEITLRGEVKVIETKSDGNAGHVTTTNKMRVKLKKKPGS